jgi:hypothetical protein
VLMPETAIHKDDCFVAGKDQVGLSWQVFAMQPVTQSCRMHCFANHQLRFCIAALYCCHVSAAGRGVMDVRHTSGSFALPDRLNQSPDVRLHDSGDCLEHRDRHRIAELFIRLRI